MSNVLSLICVECGRSHRSGEVEYVCHGCEGNLDVQYDYDKVRSELNKESLARDDNFTIWRYRPLLPIDHDSRVPPLTVGWTPIYDCSRIAERHQIRQLLIKDDGRNPTASYKDRPSALAVARAMATGAKTITTASSGNAGSALAGLCASVGMESVIFVPVSAPPAKIAQLQIYGAIVVLVEGSYDEAYDLCLEASKRFGWYQRSTGYNPFTREGKKTAALEIAEQLSWDPPDTVIVPVGDGNIISGLWKGFNDLVQLGFIDRRPQMIGVQSTAAPAVVNAVASDGRIREAPANTRADSINVGKPRDATMAIRAIQESGGRGLKVSDEEIVRAIPELARYTGVFVEPAAAAAYAGFIKLSEDGSIDREQRVLLMLTGNGLKDVDGAKGAIRDPMHVSPNIDLLELENRVASARESRN